MKAAIYCRLSKEDEDLEKENRGKESESIQNQKSMLIDYALEKGYEILMRTTQVLTVIGRILIG